MTDIEPAIRKALRPRIGNVERRTRYLLDAHAVAVAVVVARERRQHDDAQRVMADDINRIAAERDEARETAANLATVWDRERETLQAHASALTASHAATVNALTADLQRVKDQASEDVHALSGAVGEIEALTAERDRLREQLAAEQPELSAVVHLLNPRNGDMSACLDGWRRTQNAAEVTCGNCKRTHAYAEAGPAPAAQTPATGTTPAPGGET